MPTLYDMVMRHALYFEGARRGASADFAKIVRGLDTEILRVFQTVTVDTFGNMTKAEFNRFVGRLRGAMNKVFQREGKRLNSIARNVSDIEAGLYQRMFQSNTGRRRTINRDAIWKEVRNRDIAATGGSMQRAANAFRNSSINEIETVVRRAYANKQSVQEAVSAIRGVKSRSFRNGSLSKISGWSDSYFDTIFHHVGQSVKYKVSSQFYEQYDWISILDDNTTEICRDRAFVRYTYGEGPIPPAHYRCRSEIVPVADDEPAPPKSFSEWLKDQPDEFLDDVFRAAGRSMDNLKTFDLGALRGKLPFILS